MDELSVRPEGQKSEPQRTFTDVSRRREANKGKRDS